MCIDSNSKRWTHLAALLIGLAIGVFGVHDSSNPCPLVDGNHQYFDGGLAPQCTLSDPDTESCCTQCTSCLVRPVDIVFAVDGSTSVTGTQWAQTKQFIHDIVANDLENYFATRSSENVSIARGTLRVGMVIFGDTALTVFSLDEYYQNRAGTLAGILGAFKPGGGTQTHRAIAEASGIFSNSDASIFTDTRRVLVLITDGVASSRVSQLVSEVNAMSSIDDTYGGAEVVRLAIAIFQSITDSAQRALLVSQLSLVVTPGYEVQTTESFDNLSQLVRWLSSAFCFSPSCTVGFHEDIPCNATADRHCAPNAQCRPNQYISNEATYTTDRICVNASIGCPVGNYIVAFPTATSDRVCDICPNGSYQSTTSGDTCAPHTVCIVSGPGQQYETRAPTLTSNRLCNRIRSCSQSQYISAFATATTDTQCTSVTNGCPHRGQYISIPASSTSDRVCSSCQPGTFQPTQNGRPCSPWYECEVEDEIEILAPTLSSDRVCVIAQQCSNTEYAAIPATLTSNAVCRSVSIGCPSAGLYISEAATESSDRICSPCLINTYRNDSSGDPCHSHRIPCITGVQYEKQSPTPTSNRVCQNYTLCNRSEYSSSIETPTSDRQCSPVTIGCPEVGYYAVEPPTLISDRACAPCPPSTFNPSRVFVTYCQNHTVCGRDSYQSIAPTSSTDRQCTGLTTCGVGDFTVADPTATTDRRCSTYMCGAGRYVTSAAGNFTCATCPLGTYSDTDTGLGISCVQHSPCVRASTFEWIAPTTTSDRVCVETTTCGSDDYVNHWATLLTDRECNEASTIWQSYMIAVIVLAIVGCCCCLWCFVCLYRKSYVKEEATFGLEVREYSREYVRKMVTLAIENFEAYNQRPYGSCTVDEVLATSKGIEGWAAMKPIGVYSQAGDDLGLDTTGLIPFTPGPASEASSRLFSSRLSDSTNRLRVFVPPSSGHEYSGAHTGQTSTSPLPIFMNNAAFENPSDSNHLHDFDDLGPGEDIDNWPDLHHGNVNTTSDHSRGSGDSGSDPDGAADTKKLVSKTELFELIEKLHADENGQLELQDFGEFIVVNELREVLTEQLPLLKFNKYDTATVEEFMRSLGTKQDSQVPLLEFIEAMKKLFAALSEESAEETSNDFGNKNSEEAKPRKLLSKSSIFLLFEQLNRTSADSTLDLEDFGQEMIADELKDVLGEKMHELDRDNDGSIDAAEIMAALDTNGDGKVSVLEFMKEMRKLL